MGCYPERGKAVICVPDVKLDEFFHAVKEYERKMKDYVPYIDVVRLTMSQWKAIPPELPIKASEYASPELFYMAIAVRLAYDILHKTIPLVYYYDGFQFDEKPRPGSTVITVSPTAVPLAGLPEEIATVIDMLKRHVSDFDLVGIHAKKYVELLS